MNFWTDRKNILQIGFIYCCGFVEQNIFQAKGSLTVLSVQLPWSVIVGTFYWSVICDSFDISCVASWWSWWPGPRVSSVPSNTPRLTLSHSFLASQGPGLQSAVKQNYLDWILSDTNWAVHLSFIALRGWHLMRKIKLERHYFNELPSIESINQQFEQLDWNLHMTYFWLHVNWIIGIPALCGCLLFKGTGSNSLVLTPCVFVDIFYWGWTMQNSCC